MTASWLASPDRRSSTSAASLATLEARSKRPSAGSLEIVETEPALTVKRAHAPGPSDGALTLRGPDGRTEGVVAGGADACRAMIDHFGAVVRGKVRPWRTPADSVAVLDRLRSAASPATRRTITRGSASS
jgi:hypothetical protein